MDTDGWVQHRLLGVVRVASQREGKVEWWTPRKKFKWGNNHQTVL